MKNYFFLAILLCLFFSGCNERVFKLRGKVLDEKTLNAVPLCKILVQELVQADKETIPVKSHEIFTDSAGEFSYDLRTDKSIYLFNFYVVGNAEYSYSGKPMNLVDLRKYGEIMTFYVRRLADFTIAIEKKTKASLKDTLYVRWKSDGVDGRLLYPYKINNYGHYGNSSDMEFRWIGGNIKSVIKTKVFADKETIISWELYRNGENRKFTDTITCMRDVNNYSLIKY